MGPRTCGSASPQFIVYGFTPGWSGCANVDGAVDGNDRLVSVIRESTWRNDMLLVVVIIKR